MSKYDKEHQKKGEIFGTASHISSFLMAECSMFILI